MSALVLAAPAFGQAAVGDRHSDKGGWAQSQGSEGWGIPVSVTADSEASDRRGGSGLPFIGLDLVVLAGTAALLAGAGVAMWRLTRPPESGLVSSS